MTFEWSTFFGGVLAAGVFGAFTMTLGGPPAAVTAVGIPIAAGIAGILVATLRTRLRARQEAST